MKAIEFVFFDKITATAIKKACASAAPAGWTPRARIEVRARLASLGTRLAAELPGLLGIALRAVLRPANITVWTDQAAPVEPLAGAADREVARVFGPAHTIAEQIARSKL